MEQADLYQDIPKEFHSFETSGLFEHCIECESYLLDDKEYVIEKAIRKYKDYSAMDTVFDYAICVDCAMKMREEFSKESIKRVDAFFQKAFDKIQIPQKQEGDLVMEKCLSTCLVNNNAIEELEEYQIYAYLSLIHI